MIIGIDGNEANTQKRVGVNVYAYELIWNLYKELPAWPHKHHLIVYLKNNPIGLLPEANEFLSYKVLPAKRLWILTQLMPKVIFNSDRLDILFSPSHYVTPLSSVARVCAVMDLGYLKFSAQFKKYDFWQLKLWSAYSIFVSKCIITISETTKKDIIKNYKSAAKKIFVTPLGYNQKQYNTSINKSRIIEVKSKYSIVGDYILFMSTLKPSKNVEGLVKAWSIISQEFADITLVIAGKKGWLYESIYKEVQDNGLEKRVIFTDFVPEEEKEHLLKGAKAFLLPSFWEGFGLEALECMASGIPVVVSNKASLPEVVGDAGILVDPYDPKDIARGIKKVLSMPKTDYNKLIASGLKRARDFSWQKTAKLTLEALESMKK